MKSFNILGFHWKIQFLGEGGGGERARKTNINGDSLKRGDLDSLQIQGEGGLGKKEGGVFMRGVDALMHTVWHVCI